MIVLTWKIDKTAQTACPDFKPDPYAGEFPMTQCAVYHTRTITQEMSKEFETKEEAEEFKKNAPPACYDFNLLEERKTT